MATNANRGKAIGYKIVGDDENANPLIASNALMGAIIPIGPNGMIGWVKNRSNQDPCHEPIWTCPEDGQIVTEIIHDGHASQRSYRLIAPVAFFAAQTVYLDYANSTQDVPVYVVDLAAPNSQTPPDLDNFKFVGWTTHSGAAGTEMEVAL